MPLVPADFCLNCNYSLAGLPPRHRCPECGLEYDEHVRVWKPAHSWKKLLPVVFVPPVLFAALIQCGGLVRPIGRFGPAITLVILLGAAAAVTWGVWRVMKASQRGVRVSLSRDGVGIRMTGQDGMVPWDQAVEAVPYPRDPARNPSGVMITRIGAEAAMIRHFFSGREEIAEFLSEFHRARRIYTAAGAMDDDTVSASDGAAQPRAAL